MEGAVGRILLPVVESQSIEPECITLTVQPSSYIFQSFGDVWGGSCRQDGFCQSCSRRRPVIPTTHSLKAVL